MRDNEIQGFLNRMQQIALQKSEYLPADLKE